VPPARPSTLNPHNMSGRRPPREPNVGTGGNVLLVSMRDIAAGEELTIDHALFLGDAGFAME
jgi:hypothetical protein